MTAKGLAETVPKDLPSQLEVDFDEGPTPIYLAICSGDWSATVSIAQKNPIEAKTWVVRYKKKDSKHGNTENEKNNNAEKKESEKDSRKKVLWRFLPLHSACARQPPESVIEALLTANPEAASIGDDQGMLPIHYACGNCASDAVVNMLLLAYPQGVVEKDPVCGKLPIHHVCQWGPSTIGVLNMLLVMYPASINEKDSSGLTPLGCAKEGKYIGKNNVILVLKRSSVATKFVGSSPCSIKIQGKHSPKHTSKNTESEDMTIAREEIEKSKQETIARNMIIQQRDVAIKKERNIIQVKEKKIVSLSEELASVRKELDAIKKEKQDKDKDEKLGNSEQNESVEILSEKISILHFEVNRHKKARKDREIECQKIKHEIDVYENRITSLNKAVSQLHEEVEVSKKQMEEERFYLNQMIADEKNMVTQLTRELNEVQKHAGITKKELDTQQLKFKNYASKKEETIFALEGEIARLCDECKISKKTTKKLREIIAANDLEMRQEKPKIESLIRKIEILEKERNDSKSEKEALLKEVEGLRVSKTTEERSNSKLDAVNERVASLLGKQNAMMETAMHQEMNIKSASKEREQRIMELALLEKKVRNSSVESYVRLTEAMQSQQQSLAKVLSSLQR